MNVSPSIRKVLFPLAPAYRLALWLRERRLGTRTEPVRRLRFPVVSVGNLSTGGAGKTPLAIALAHALTNCGLQVDVLSRGYGRAIQLPTRVHLNGTAEDFGDEPLLISRATGVPVYVAPRRFDAGLLAEGDAAAIAFLGETPKPVVHLLDDGFQHRELHRDADIVLLNRQDWTDSLLPAGNLREPLKSLHRATIIAVPADDPGLHDELKAWGWAGPVWLLHRKMDIPPIDGPVAAFCGIARPDQFFAGLEAGGLQLALRKVFPDHHPYATRDVDHLLASARSAEAVALLTTEKDYVRLGKLASTFRDSLPLKPVALHIEIDEPETAIEGLLAHLKLVPPLPSL